MIFRGYDMFQRQNPWGPKGSRFWSLGSSANLEVLSALDEDGDGKVDLQEGARCGRVSGLVWVGWH